MDATAAAIRTLLEAETQARQTARMQAGGQAREGDGEGGEGGGDANQNPTTWWPGRTEFTQAMNEVDSKIGGADAQEFWWLANAPWFLPPPPEWGPIKPQMYSTYYFKPPRHNYELPNVQKQNAPWFAPHYQTQDAQLRALGYNRYGVEQLELPSANQLAGPSVSPAAEFATMGIDDAFKMTINQDKVQIAEMGGRNIEGSDVIPNYGNRAAILGPGSSQYSSPYVMHPCNPYLPQSCGAFHPGWHPEPPRQNEFYPPHDAPTFSPDSSKAVPPLGGEPSFLETDVDVHTNEEEADAELLEVDESLEADEEEEQ